jgi:hypothetical protein
MLHQRPWCFHASLWRASSVMQVLDRESDPVRGQRVRSREEDSACYESWR